MGIRLRNHSGLTSWHLSSSVSWAFLFRVGLGPHSAPCNDRVLLDGNIPGTYIYHLWCATYEHHSLRRSKNETGIYEGLFTSFMVVISAWWEASFICDNLCHSWNISFRDSAVVDVHKFLTAFPACEEPYFRSKALHRFWERSKQVWMVLYMWK